MLCELYLNLKNVKREWMKQIPALQELNRQIAHNMIILHCGMSAGGINTEILGPRPNLVLDV